MGIFITRGFFQRATDTKWLNRSRVLKEKALHLRGLLNVGKEIQGEDLSIQDEINGASQELNHWLYETAKGLLNQGKWVSVIGGDHSSPYGLIKALKEKYARLSLLHIDAHMDLREAYQGYQHSHASIMDNVVRELNPHSWFKWAFGIFVLRKGRKWSPMPPFIAS